MKYDAFEHLTGSLFSSKRDLFVMLAAYFDDSGSSADNRIAVVAGYIATTKMWQIFNQRWATLLEKYGLTYLRRTDLENFQGQFKNWDSKRRTEFIKKAQAIIRRCTYSGFGVALIKADFDALIGKHEILRRLGIFAWCAQGCLASISLWANEKGLKEPFQYVFEAGTVGSAQFHNVMQIMCHDDTDRDPYHIGGWSFVGKELMPLQAADTVAYEFYKYVHNEKIEGNKRAIRLSARDLFRQHEIKFFRQFDRKSFESFIKRWKNPVVS